MLLQQSLTDSVHFLLPHTHQQAKEELTQLRNDLQLLRGRLQPKTKFAFGVRKSPQQPLPVTKPQSKTPSARYTVDPMPMLHDLVDAHVSLEADQVTDGDVLLSDLRGCEVRVRSPAATLHVTRLFGCVMLCAPVARSIFLEDCKNCTLVVACQQLRMHSVRASRIYLRVTSRAIIEDCSELQIAPYALHYTELASHLSIAGLAGLASYWDHIDDFNHLSKDVPSPNWTVLPEAERQAWTDL